MKSKQPRAVVVTRHSWYEELLGRHGTREQAKFFLDRRDQSIVEVEEQHHQFQHALGQVLQGIPGEWRRTRLDRSDLDRFLFEPDDIIIAVGQDGLVANAAKYLSGQPVVGINPHPDHNEGVLVRFPSDETGELLQLIVNNRGEFEARAMAHGIMDDGQELLAINELFVGHRSHQSARYDIHWHDQTEYQSSSGLIVSTGTGASGWTRSIVRQRKCKIELPEPVASELVFLVREAWPSVSTSTTLVEGKVNDKEELIVTSRMNDGGVIFGDGIEEDRITFDWGRRARISVAESKLMLLVA